MGLAGCSHGYCLPASKGLGIIRGMVRPEIGRARLKRGAEMADNKAKVTLEEIFSQIDEFEKAIDDLEGNIKKFRQKLEKSKQKYGQDISKWPTIEDKLDY